jgi:hypothetical protein
MKSENTNRISLKYPAEALPISASFRSLNPIHIENIHWGNTMKSLARTISISCIFLGLSNLAAPLVGQNKQMTDLEKRVEVLEQKVKTLEGRLAVAFGGKGEEIRQINRIMLQDFSNIAAKAHEYYLRSSIQNGRPHTYVGFTLPLGVGRKDLASYTLTTGESEVIIEGWPMALGGSMRARVGIDGKLRDWTYTGDFVEAHNLGVHVTDPGERHWEDFNNEMTSIAALAYQYRVRSRGATGGGGSYAGFVIPQDLAATSVGLYRIVRQDTELVIEGLLRNSNTVKEVIFDSMGKIQKTISNSYSGQLMKPINGPRSALDSLREFISNDFIGIAARAFEYKKRPAANGGGGGSYSGYLSAQIASTDGNATYEIITEPNMMYLNAVSTQGLGSVRARVDGSGKLSGWYYTGRLAE